MSKPLAIAAFLLSLLSAPIPVAADELSDLSARWVALGLFELGRCSAVFPGSNPQAAKTASNKLFELIVNKYGPAKTRSALDDELETLGFMRDHGDSWATLCREWEKDTRLRVLHPEVFAR